MKKFVIRLGVVFLILILLVVILLPINNALAGLFFVAAAAWLVACPVLVWVKISLNNKE